MEVTNFGYYWLDTWVLANVIQLTTQDFCRRYLNRTNDPCGRQYDQMTQAARSVPANIAEGNSRHSTSKETEMKLTDVARASLAELANDYINWLMAHEQIPWSIQSDEYKKIAYIRLDRPNYKDDVQHQSCIHILSQKHKFDQWISSNDSINPLQPSDNDAQKTNNQSVGNIPRRRRLYRGINSRAACIPCGTKCPNQRSSMPQMRQKNDKTCV